MLNAPTSRTIVGPKAGLMLTNRMRRCLLFLYVLGFMTFAVLDFLPVFVFKAPCGAMSAVATMIKIGLIVFNPIFVSIFYREDKLLLLALIFTLIADTILLFVPGFWAGILVFIVAQYCHTLRMKIHNKIFWAVYGAILLVMLMSSLIFVPNIRVALAVVYAGTIVVNLVTAALIHRRDIFIGFLLFLLCDICVVISSMTELPVIVLQVAGYLVWFFYYPSQVILANTGR